MKESDILEANISISVVVYSLSNSINALIYNSLGCCSKSKPPVYIKNEFIQLQNI